MTQYSAESGASIRLRRARELSGKSLVQAAMLVGRSRQTLHKWERDPCETKAGNLAQLCEIYGVGLDTVIFGASDPPLSADARRIATEFDAQPLHVQRQWLLLWQVLGRRGVADPVAGR